MSSRQADPLELTKTQYRHVNQFARGTYHALSRNRQRYRRSPGSRWARNPGSNTCWEAISCIGKLLMNGREEYRFSPPTRSSPGDSADDGWPQNHGEARSHHPGKSETPHRSCGWRGCEPCGRGSHRRAARRVGISAWPNVASRNSSAVPSLDPSSAITVSKSLSVCDCQSQKALPQGGGAVVGRYNDGRSGIEAPMVIATRPLFAVLALALFNHVGGQMSNGVRRFVHSRLGSLRPPSRAWHLRATFKSNWPIACCGCRRIFSDGLTTCCTRNVSR